jgi:ribonuclease G
VVHRELEMTASLIRDLFTDDVEEVTIDDKDAFAEIQSYLKQVSPELRDRVTLYKGTEPIFDAFEIEQQIEKTFERNELKKKMFAHMTEEQIASLQIAAPTPVPTEKLG